MTDAVRKALELAAKSSFGSQAIPHEVSEAAKKALADLEASPTHIAHGIKSIHLGPPLTDEEMIAITSGNVKPEDCGMRQVYPAKPAASQDVAEVVAKAICKAAHPENADFRQAWEEYRVGYLIEAGEAIAAYEQFLEEGTVGSGNAPVSSSANQGSEISVVDEGELKQKMLNADIHCDQCADIALEAVRPYLRSTEPVPEDGSKTDSIAEAVSFGLINAEPFTTEEVIRVALAWLNGALPVERKSEPVSVSLEECAKAIWQYDDKGDMQGIIPWENAGSFNRNHYVNRAKAVLEAAGVKYHEY